MSTSNMQGARLLSALASGILFGLGLVISQMVNPAKVIGFLDVAGNWDPDTRCRSCKRPGSRNSCVSLDTETAAPAARNQFRIALEDRS